MVCNRSSMNRILLLLIASVAIARAVTPIVIRNPSFEEVVTLANGAYTSGDIPSWEDRVAATVASGVFNPDTPLDSAASGQQVVFLNSTGYLNQDLKFANNS